MSGSSTTDTLDNIKAISGQSSNRRRMVSLFAGWPFIRFREGDDESFPLMPNFSFDSPTFEYNPNCFALEQLENPTYAPFWLPLALSQICTHVLAEAMNDPKERIGKLVGEGWNRFREELCKQCGMTMEEIVANAMYTGFHNGVMYMTQCIYYETGLHDAIEARQSGRPVLRTA